MKAKNIVFIHGMYMNSLCWEHWVTYCQAKGYTCLAPDCRQRQPPSAVGHVAGDAPLCRDVSVETDPHSWAHHGGGTEDVEVTWQCDFTR